MRRTRWIVAGAAIAIALAYLRDPPWLLHMSSGLRPWETGADGRRARWMGGHASFFVPSTAPLLRMPVRAAFEHPADRPIALTITIDDRLVERVLLSDDAWRIVTLRLPSPGGRRVRRVDIRADRTRDGNRSALVGEVEFPISP